MSCAAAGVELAPSAQQSRSDGVRRCGATPKKPDSQNNRKNSEQRGELCNRALLPERAGRLRSQTRPRFGASDGGGRKKRKGVKKIFKKALRRFAIPRRVRQGLAAEGNAKCEI
jgi:hypothetical protein